MYDYVQSVYMYVGQVYYRHVEYIMRKTLSSKMGQLRMSNGSAGKIAEKSKESSDG